MGNIIVFFSFDEAYPVQLLPIQSGVNFEAYRAWGFLYYCLEMVKYLDTAIQFINTKTFNIRLIDWTIIFDHKFEAYFS